MTSIEAKMVRELRQRGYRVLRRKDWGSQHRGVYQWRRVHRRFVGPADYAFAHISVTRDTGDAKADARTIERIGMDRFGTGWSYNWGVHKSTKTIIVGQSHDAAGAHTLNDKKVPGFQPNLNYWGHAIAFIAMPDDEFDDWCEGAVAAIIAAEKKHGAMKPGADLHPHSKFAWKDCPCDGYRDAIPRIERAASEPVEYTRGRRVDTALDLIGKAIRLSPNGKRREGLLEAASRKLSKIKRKEK